MTQFGARRHSSPPQADAGHLERLRQIPLPLLSDNIHRGTGAVGLRPDEVERFAQQRNEQ